MSQLIEGTCAMCGARSMLVESHIIPRAFRQACADPGERVERLSIAQPPRRSPTLAYARFLCSDCEESLGSWDSYAADLLLHWPEAEHGAAVLNYSYERLKLFFLSVLWRALHFKVDGYNFDLGSGSRNERLASAVRARAPGAAHDFRTVVVMLEDVRMAPVVLPVASKSNPNELVATGFGRHEAWTWVGEQPPDDRLFPDEFVMHPDRPLRFARDRYLTEHRVGDFATIVKQSEANRGRRR